MSDFGLWRIRCVVASLRWIPFSVERNLAQVVAQFQQPSSHLSKIVKTALGPRIYGEKSEAAPSFSIRLSRGSARFTIQSSERAESDSPGQGEASCVSVAVALGYVVGQGGH
jgi:hypothetical protein